MASYLSSDEVYLLAKLIILTCFYLPSLAFFQESFQGGSKPIVMQISIVGLTFSLFSDKIFGGGTASGGAPFPCGKKSVSSWAASLVIWNFQFSIGYIVKSVYWPKKQRSSNVHFLRTTRMDDTAKGGLTQFWELFSVIPWALKRFIR